MAKIKPKKTKNKRTSRIKKHVIEVIMLSLIIFAIFFCVFHIVKLAIKPTKSFLIEQGKISQKETLVGYVIRDEKIISEGNGQKLVQIKNEGERASVGEPVFRYEAENEQELNDKIEQLNLKIQEALEGETEIFSSDIKALETQIENRIYGMKNRNNIQEIKEYKTDINGYITKKAKISGELSPAGTYINDLITERINIENELRNNSKYENAPIGGIVSYRVDGLENTLTANSFDSMTSDTLKNLNLVTGQVVTTNEATGKVINNFICYIATTSNTNEAKKAAIGDKIKIKLADGTEIPATVEYIKQEEKDVLLILKVTQGVEYLTSYRKISLDLIWWEKEGLRIPNSSIIYENGLSYIIRTKGGVLNKILVKVVKENDNYSIIKNYTTEELKDIGFDIQEIESMKKINIYDEILSDPDIEEINKELN